MADHEDYETGSAPAAHKVSHQYDGADEISIAGLAGVSAALGIHSVLPEVHHAIYTDADAIAALAPSLALLPTKTTSSWSKTIGSGCDYEDWATMIAAMPDLIADSVTVTIKAGTTLIEQCNIRNKHGITSIGVITIQAEKYFPTSGALPTADSATATTLRDAALATASLGNDYFNGCWVFIHDGTGTDNGFVLITDYVDATGDILVASWPGTQPDNTSKYMIVGALIDSDAVRGYGLYISENTCNVRFRGIGIDNSTIYNFLAQRNFNVDVRYCAFYASYYSAVFSSILFRFLLLYCGVVNNNTANIAASAGICVSAVLLMEITNCGISDNKRHGILLSDGGFGIATGCFGDCNGAWGSYAKHSSQLKLAGSECSGTSGNHSDPGTAGTAGEDQASAYV